MKVRNGFVSNSSSSSFIVISDEDLEIPEFYNQVKKNLVIPNDFGGNFQFGWEKIRYSHFNDKLNWAYLQAQYASTAGAPGKKEIYLQMLEEVLKEVFGINEVKVNLLVEDYSRNYDEDYDEEGNDIIYGYIDHQSTLAEDPENKRIFQTKEMLKNFLLSSKSFIQGGNDNE